jgi:replicative DNA helicase
VVGLLVRPEYYSKDDEEKKDEHEGEAELIIAKHRNGPTGEIPLTFVKRFARSENAIQEEAVPAGRSPYTD